MNYLTKTALLLFSVSLLITSPQSARNTPGQAQETRVLGHWIDPSTRQMWAGKDNGTDVNWHQAMKYCRDLRLAGYSNWRLANIGELQGIYDKTANAPGLAGEHDDVQTMWHVKGNLFLTGYHWSSTRLFDDRGRPAGYAFRFDFNEGRQFDGDELSFRRFKRALCVRTPEK